VQISNIQENLSKTELVQRLQQIMQDAARAAQAVHTTAGDERSRVATEQVEDSQQTEQEGVRPDERQPRDGNRQHRERRASQGEDETDHDRRHNTGSEGRIIDVTV
jgi:hypothetical protein